jgi:hypothetical protein
MLIQSRTKVHFFIEKLLKNKKKELLLSKKIRYEISQKDNSVDNRHYLCTLLGVTGGHAYTLGAGMGWGSDVVRTEEPFGVGY